MEIFKQIAPLKAFLKDFKCPKKLIGLVPTMGALHAGHLSLIRASQAQNEVTVGSIFVNPTQFNNQNDLIKYPRSIEKDTELLRSVGCDVLFNPPVQEIYPEKSVLGLDFGYLDKIMEGKFRPGHFSGVGLVVSKLFNIVQPDRAYFGQKDWQQLAIIQKLVDEMHFQVEVNSVPTLRESDGLALSSRNLRLSKEQRTAAIVFYQALTQAKSDLLAGKKMDEVTLKVKTTVEKHPEVKLEYCELAERKNLIFIDNVQASEQPILCIAGYVGEIRLIDNMFVDQVNSQ